MATNKRQRRGARLLTGAFRCDLDARRILTVQLPEFVICALEARLASANADAPASGRVTLNDYIESEIVNLVSLRDVAELDMRMPGFADAVNAWLRQVRDG